MWIRSWSLVFLFSILRVGLALEEIEKDELGISTLEHSLGLHEDGDGGLDISDSRRKCVMVSLSVDETGSMHREHDWIPKQFTQLFKELEFKGLNSRNMMCVTGFGSQFQNGAPRSRGCSFFNSSTSYFENFKPFTSSGYWEDGFAGMSYAIGLSNIFMHANHREISEHCSSVVKILVLVTDEDRDAHPEQDLKHHDPKVVSALLDNSWILCSIIQIYLKAGPVDQAEILAIDKFNNAYVATTSGSFQKVVAAKINSDYGETTNEYAKLTFQNGGVFWNIGSIRKGGIIAQSFSIAFNSIKLSEIIAATAAPTRFPASRPVNTNMVDATQS